MNLLIAFSNYYNSEGLLLSVTGRVDGRVASRSFRMTCTMQLNMANYFCLD